MKSDIAEVIKELDFYEEEIKQRGTPDAETALENYKKGRRDLVKEIASVRYSINVPFLSLIFSDIPESVQIRIMGL